MITLSEVSLLRTHVVAARAQGQRIGLVPTMGCLHAGHRSLIKVARQHAGFVVVSLFVNPTQFGPAEDYDRYPRTLEADEAVCREDGVDVLFRPEPHAVYRPDHSVFVEETRLSADWCGRRRPGHFRGVATVVTKLFNMVQPDVAVFGQKDAQQAAVIRRLVRDLDCPIQLVVAPTVRESDGLAMSSRNRYLDAGLRRQAATIYRTLTDAVTAYHDGERNPGRLLADMTKRINAQPGLIVDYVAAVDNDTFETVDLLNDRTRLLVAVDAGDVHLIDNMGLGDETPTEPAVTG